MKSDAPTRTQLDSGTTQKRERNLRLVLVMISVAAFLGLVSIGPSPRITPRTSALAPLPCVPPPAGLVSWWPGDGNASDIQDSNAGTLQNGATAVAAGEVGQAFSFDGVDDFVNVPNNANLEPANVTVDMWFNSATPGANAYLIAKGAETCQAASYSLNTADPGGGIAFDIWNGSTLVRSPFSAAGVFDGNWHHVAGTYDGANVRLYIDGVEQGAGTATNISIAYALPTSNALTIGRYNGSCVLSYAGLLDEIEIFNRALAPAEIQSIFNAGSAGKCKGCATPPANMVGWYPGDNNANDITPSPDNGTPNGGATFASGEVAQAFSLNGTTAYVSAPDVPKINFGTGDFSIDAWIQTSNANGVQSFVDKRVGDNVAVFTGYSFFTFNGNLGAQLADGLGGGITATNFVSATNVANGAFHHVAVTVVRNSATGGNLYVDGVSVLTFDPTVRPGSLTNIAELRIGRNSPNTISDPFFSGLIDEVELFNRALSAAEVQAIFNAGSQGKCQGTITGTVTNCNTGLPIENATVSTPDGFLTQTNASGNFSITAPPGTYTVNITAPGFGTCTTNNVVVTNGGNAVVNCCLAPVSIIVPAAATLVAESCTPNNAALDPGETVTLSFCVKNTGSLNTTNLVGTLQATGGVTSIQPLNPQNYGVLVAGGPAVCKNFTFTASGTCGGTVTASIQFQDGATNLGVVTYTLTLGVQQSPGVFVCCTPPGPCMITCPANITVSNDPSQCGAVVTYPAPTTTGACGTVTCSPASGSFFPVGTTTVTCKSNSGAGPEMCTFTVKVNDTQPPSITCPANITTTTATISSPCVAVSFAPTASDFCPGVTKVCNPPSTSCFPVGTTTVTCTATDASGNTATCSFTVTVFNVCLQDDSNANTVFLGNSITGAYRFCCGGMVFTGVAQVTKRANMVTFQHNPPDRRVAATIDGGTFKGSASLQSPPGTTRCTIQDRDTRNNSCICPQL